MNISKNINILACGAAIAFAGCMAASCSNDEPEVFNPEEHIGFGAPGVFMGGPEVSDMSRGVVLNALPAGSSFGVLGYCVPTTGENFAPSDWVTKSDFAQADVFHNKKVTFDGTSCSYDGLKPWYKESDSPYLYSFFAYYPYTAANGGFTISPTASTSATEYPKGLPKITYTMPFAAGNNQSLANDVAEDVMVANVYDITKATGKVKLNFSHLLCAVRFRVNNYDGDTDVTIKGVSISGNFHRQITLDYSPVAKAQNLAMEVSGSYSGTYTFYPLPNETGLFKANTSGLLSDGETVLLLPDPNNGTLGTGVTCSFSFDFINTGQSGSKGLDNFKFEQGTLYTINLNFIGDSFTINVTSDNWENGSDNEIIIH